MRISRDFLRITGGSFRSQTIHRVNCETTKETQDIVKLAVFNMLNNQINGSVLDLFAGSGAYGFESLSRGGNSLYLVDNNIDAINVIKKNALKLKVSEVTKIYNLDYKEFVKRNKNITFDYIFLDPPYALITDFEEFFNLIKIISNKNTKIIIESLITTNYDTSQFNILNDRNFSRKNIKILTFK
jgi:16S rRNA (guanine966-N2)-methyltransferase